MRATLSIVILSKATSQQEANGDDDSHDSENFNSEFHGASLRSGGVSDTGHKASILPCVGVGKEVVSAVFVTDHDFTQRCFVAVRLF